ncbi:hypothetical protein GDO81_028979 [Engystomops pustulosus]|uniref:Uncharacterized protein n=1 Tax=Engystomops pustulosus TaxID=76066 RepID=A0AAV6YMN4_ENGPU|nr:hypothetical protein GDO81_028979 [Engystomops pustulosus]
MAAFSPPLVCAYGQGWSCSLKKNFKIWANLLIIVQILFFWWAYSVPPDFFSGVFVIVFFFLRILCYFEASFLPHSKLNVNNSSFLCIIMAKLVQFSRNSRTG